MEKIQHIWPTMADLARDLGLPYQTVVSWGVRGIPAKRFGAIISAAAARGHVLSWEDLDGSVRAEGAA